MPARSVAGRDEQHPDAVGFLLREQPGLDDVLCVVAVDPEPDQPQGDLAQAALGVVHDQGGSTIWPCAPRSPPIRVTTEFIGSRAERLTPLRDCAAC